MDGPVPVLVSMLGFVPLVVRAEVGMVGPKRDDVQMSSTRPVRVVPRCDAIESLSEDERRQQEEGEQDPFRAATPVLSIRSPADHRGRNTIDRFLPQLATRFRVSRPGRDPILPVLMEAAVLDTRGSGPPLVYVPGIDGSGEMLLGGARRLERRFRLTRLRYGGDASGGYAELARSVVERFDELAVERPLVLAESFGAAVALQVALDQPARVAGLALVNGFARFDDRLGLAITRGVFALAPQAWIHAGRRRFAQRGLFAPRRDERALDELLALRGDWFDERYRARLAWIARLDLRPRLGEVRCPVALFAADHDRVVAALRAGHEMAARIPDCELTVLERAGHVVLPLDEEPWVERMERLARRAGAV